MKASPKPTPKQKKKVASRSSSGSSDDSSQKTHKKNGGELDGSLKCKLEQGSDCSIQSQAGDAAMHQVHPSAGLLDAFG